MNKQTKQYQSERFYVVDENGICMSFGIHELRTAELERDRIAEREGRAMRLRKSTRYTTVVLRDVD